MNTVTEIIADLDWCFSRTGNVRHDCRLISYEDWQTLKACVLAQQTNNKQSIKLPKEAIENITECISNQRDVSVEFKARLVNDFWDLL